MFAEQVSHMQKNDMAGPVQTPNGYHIIRIADLRAESAATPDKKTIERLLLQQKFEDAVQNWVAKLRSQAYIVMQEPKAMA